MNKKLLPLLTLALMLILVAPTYAQSASTDEDGGLPILLIAIAIGAVILALVTRNITGLGSRRAGAVDELEEDDDEVVVERPRRQSRRKRRARQHDDDDAEIYLIERDNVWEDDGYGGEEDVGF